VPNHDCCSDNSKMKVEPSSIIEGAVLKFVQSNSIDGHSSGSRGWIACGMEHGIPLARFVRRAQGWILDFGFSRPIIER
jgi:hypothetical protein